MQLVVIGSGTVVPHAERVCASYYVEHDDARLLLDCGPGAVHHLARFGVPWARLTHLALSHFHTDHVGDVPALLFALKWGLAEPRTAELRVAGPSGTALLFRHLEQAHGDYMLDPGFPLVIGELLTKEELALGDNVRLRAHATPHTAASLAYRIDTPHAALGYTGDTGFSEELGRFFRGVHTLIAECSLPDEIAIDMHLTPSRAAKLAAIARPQCLVLTHVYPQLEQRDLAGLVRNAGWSGETVVAYDGLRLDIGSVH